MLANTARLTRRMAQLGLDGLVATTPANVYYLTGIANVTQEVLPYRGQCYAVVTRDRPDRPALVLPRGDMDQVLDARVPVGDAIGFGSYFREVAATAELTEEQERFRRLALDGPFPHGADDALVTALRHAGLDNAVVGIDEEGTARELVKSVSTALPHVDIRAGAAAFRWVRKVKTDAELDRLRTCTAIAERGIAAILDRVQAGVTEVELCRAFDQEVVRHGARPRFTLLRFGSDAVMGQRRPRDVPLRRNTPIWMDVGCVYEGYWSDLAHVCSLGEPATRILRYHAAMLAGWERAYTVARAGMRASELFESTVTAVRSAGVAQYRRHHVGHGIGVEIYDPVVLTPDNDERLEPGTVVNAETPYHEIGFGSVQVEAPFVVGQETNTALGSPARALSIID